VQLLVGPGQHGAEPGPEREDGGEHVGVQPVTEAPSTL
jgi:hypothetical protein